MKYGLPLVLLGLALHPLAAQSPTNFFVDPPDSIKPADTFILRADPVGSNPEAGATYEHIKVGEQIITKFNINKTKTTPMLGRTLRLEQRIAAGTLLKASVKVRGSLTESSANLGKTFWAKIGLLVPEGMNAIDPIYLVRVGSNEALVETFDWTTFEVVFLLPENIKRIELMCYVDNSIGEVEIKERLLTVAEPGTPITPQTKP
jgi:hypothetical protein